MKNKRVLTVFLTTALVFTSVPIPAMAENSTPAQEEYSFSAEEKAAAHQLADQITVNTYQPQAVIDEVDDKLPTESEYKLGEIDTGFRAPSPKQYLDEKIVSQEVPSSYDLRDHNLVTPVKDQGRYGTCWAFAATASLESSLIKAYPNHYTKDTTDLSEMGVAYSGTHVSKTSNDLCDFLLTLDGRSIVDNRLRRKLYGDMQYGGLQDLPDIGYLDGGGSSFMPIFGTCRNWGILEDDADIRYPLQDRPGHRDLARTQTENVRNVVEDKSSQEAILDECQYVPMEDAQLVKQMLMSNGCAAVSFYVDSDNACFSTKPDPDDPDETITDLANYCCIGETSANHAVTLIGWDDDYPASNFNGIDRPQKNGAWILKNSWGTFSDWDGYFYISYEDTSLMSNDARFFKASWDSTEAYHYSHFDIADGKTLSLRNDSYTQANIYRVPSNHQKEERITRVGFFSSGADTDYTISIYKNPEMEKGYVKNPKTGKLIGYKEGKEACFGYFTIPIECSETLSAGDVVSTVISQKTGEGQSYLMSEYGCKEDPYSYAWVTTALNGERVVSTLNGEYFGERCIEGSIKQGESYLSADGNTFSDYVNVIEALGDSYLGNLMVNLDTEETSFKSTDQQIEIREGQSVNASAYVDLGDYMGAVSYNSSAPDVATVDDDGDILAVKKGDTVISVITENGTLTLQVKVCRNLSSSSITVKPIPTQQYIGDEIVPDVEIMDGTYRLVEDVDYTLRGMDNKDIGTEAKVVITGEGYYDGTLTESFTIVDTSKWELYLDDGYSYLYSGEAIEPSLSVYEGDNKVPESDYEVTYRNNLNAGYGAVMVKDKDGICQSVWFEIEPRNLTYLSCNRISDRSFGSASPSVNEIQIFYNGQPLTANRDFSYSYRNVGAVGGVHGVDSDPMIVVTGQGNFKGVKKLRFNIYASRSEGDTSLAEAKVKNVKDRVYTGDVITQLPTVTYKGDTLEEGKDYYITYENQEGVEEHTNVGKITMIIHGIGDYKETVKKTFSIKPRSLKSAGISIQLDQYQYEYTGSKIIPNVSVFDSENVPLEEGEDYLTPTVSGKGKAGTATVTVKAKKGGNYTGSKKLKFRILKAGQKEIKLKDTLNDYYYSGTAIKPKIKELVSENGVVLPIGREYKISFQDNKEVGTAVVMITGKGKNKGIVGYTTFEIVPQAASNLDYSVRSVTMFGRVLYVKAVVKNGKKKLKEGTDYFVNYYDGDEEGTGKAYLTFQGNYTGTKKLTFSY